jgi:two-component sensor histidine kinase
MNHRVKNSLSIVGGMLRLQANDADDGQVAELLNKASHRVDAIAKAHDQLSQGSDVERMDVGKYIKALCHDLDESVAQCDVRTEIDEGVIIPTDRAVSTALIVNELIANAAKYAYESHSGVISVKVARGDGNNFIVSVRDEGAGMPEDIDSRDRKGLGMRIIASFTRQLNATIEMKEHDPGTEFIVSIPLQTPS